LRVTLDEENAMQNTFINRTTRRGLKPLAIAALALTALAVHAELPPERSEGGVIYRVGGIGANEAMAMRAVRDDYALALTFVERGDGRDMYTGGVQVRIVDAEGKVRLATESPGPMLLARLPHGRYTVEATLGDDTQSRDVEIVEGAPQRLVMAWAAQPKPIAPPQ
jgi:hypothetical protein